MKSSQIEGEITLSPQMQKGLMIVGICLGLGCGIYGVTTSNKLNQKIDKNEATISKLKREVADQKTKPQIVKKTITSTAKTMTQQANEIINDQTWFMTHYNDVQQQTSSYKATVNKCGQLISSDNWNPGQPWFATPDPNLARITFSVQCAQGDGKYQCAFIITDQKDPGKLYGIIICDYNGSTFENAMQLNTQDGGNAMAQSFQNILKQGVKPR